MGALKGLKTFFAVRCRVNRPGVRSKPLVEVGVRPNRTLPWSRIAAFSHRFSFPKGNNTFRDDQVDNKISGVPRPQN